MTGGSIALRECVTLGMGCGAFLLLCLFRGPAENLALFTLAWALLIAAISLLHPARGLMNLLRSRLLGAAMTAAMIALVVSYQLSHSKADSFVPTLIVGLGVVGFVLGRLWGSVLTLGLVVMTLLVVGFALNSLLDLVVVGAVDGPFVDSNTYAALLCLTLMPWLHYYFSAVWAGQPLSISIHTMCLVVAFVLIAVLFATYSRTAAMTLSVAFVLWVGSALIYKKPLWPVLACLLIGSLAYLLVETLTPPGTGGHEFSGESLSNGLSVRAALSHWCIDHLAVDRLFGNGIGSFGLLYRMSRPLADQDTAGFYVHNDFLQLLFEGGVLLFVVLLGVAAFVGWRLLGLLRRGPSDPDFPMLGSYLALAGVLVNALVGFVFYAPFLAFAIGLLLAQVSAGKPDAIARPPARLAGFSRFSGLCAVGAVCFGWACWGYLCVDTVTAGVLGGQRGLPGVDRILADPKTRLRYALLAQALNPNRGAPVLAEAILRAQQLDGSADARQAVRETWHAYVRAAAADPWNPAIPLRMAEFVAARPGGVPISDQAQTLEQMLERSLTIDPLYVPAIDALVGTLINAGRDKDAYALLRWKVLPWLPLLKDRNPLAVDRYVGLMGIFAARYRHNDVLQRLRAFEG